MSKAYRSLGTICIGILMLMSVAGCSNRSKPAKHTHHTHTQQQTRVPKHIHNMSSTKRRGTPIVNKSKKAQHEKQALWSNPPIKKSHRQ